MRDYLFPPWRSTDASGAGAFRYAVRVVVAASHLGLSGAFVLADPLRFSGPSWNPLLAWFGGDVRPLGIMIAASGLAMLSLVPLWRVIGEFVGMLWMALLAVNFLVAIVQEPQASSTGPFAYGTLFALNLVLMVWDITDLLRERDTKRSVE